jgi:VIT1/CCC1 family predicted Fe2+/Mn2+ transporter
MRATGPTGPHRQNQRAQSQMGVVTMGKRQEMAIGIALQTQVLKTCPIHYQLCCGDEKSTDDENMARAFAVAIELVRQHQPYAEEFHHDPHELTDLLSYTIGAAPASCPECLAQRYSSKEEGAPAPARA